MTFSAVGPPNVLSHVARIDARRVHHRRVRERMMVLNEQSERARFGIVRVTGG